MIIYLGSDHRGFELKEEVKSFLLERGHKVEDKGNKVLDPDDDYPDFVIPVAREVAKDPENSRGIIFGYSGQGEAIAANRFSEARAVVYYGGPAEIITLSREHNNANILSIGAGFVGENILEKIEKWLETSFSKKDRHQRRINKAK